MSTSTPTVNRELRAVRRYEWEQIIRRARLSGVVAGSGKTGKNGRPTKGGMSGTTFKAIALGWATYANDEGKEIWAGDATVAVDLETTIKAVRTVRQTLLDLGLLKHVRGRYKDHGEEYRLTLPSDLLDRLDVPSPEQHKLAAKRLRDEARGKRGGSGGLPESGGPVDHPEPTVSLDSGGPVDHPVDNPGWSGGPAKTDPGWSGGPALGGPADPRTDHDRTIGPTDHPDRDLRTAVTVSRANDRAQDPQFFAADEPLNPAEPASAEPARPARCDHGLRTGNRPDGKPLCALCRVEARIGTPTPDPTPEPPTDPGEQLTPDPAVTTITAPNDERMPETPQPRLRLIQGDAA